MREELQGKIKCIIQQMDFIHQDLEIEYRQEVICRVEAEQT